MPSGLLEFLKRYRFLLFGLIPLIIVAGGIAKPIAMGIAGIAVIYMLIRNHHNAVIVFFLALLVMGDSREGFLIFSKDLRVSTLIIIAIYTILELLRGKYRLSRLIAWFLPFIFVSLLALIYNPMLSLAITKTMSFILLYFVVIHYLFDKMKSSHSHLIDDVVYFGHMVIALGLLLLPIFPDLVSYGGIRFNGLLGNPNGVGVYITLYIPLTAYLFEKRRNISRTYKAFAWSIIFISLLMCSSRNAIFSVTAFMLLYYGLRGNIYVKLVVGLVIMPLSALILLNIDLAQLVYSLGLGQYFRVEEFGSGSGRIFAWQHGLDLIREHPIIGCGFACEEYYFIVATSRDLWITGHQGGVHNSYLAFIINTGVVGFLLYMGFLAKIFTKIRNYHFLLAFLATAAFSAMFESWLFSSLSAFHILFLIMAMQLIADRYIPKFQLRT